MNSSKRKIISYLYFYCEKTKTKKWGFEEGIVLKLCKDSKWPEKSFSESLIFLRFVVFVVWTRLCILRRKNTNIGKTDIFGGWWVASKFSYLRPMGDKIVCGFNVPKCGLRKPTNGFCIPTCHRPADKKISVPPKVMRRSQMLPF